MKKNQGTIFSRILFASVAPFALIFALALLVVLNIVYQLHNAHVKESVVFFADHAMEKIKDDMSTISVLLRLTATNMADSVENTEEGREKIREVLHAFMNAHGEIHSAWYVFKPGAAAPTSNWYFRSFIKREGDIQELSSVSQEALGDMELSPWHMRPFNLGVDYFGTIDSWDYGLGDGRQYIGTIASPIIRKGMIIGTVGMDILYQDAFEFVQRWQEPGRRSIMLLAGNGDIISPHSLGKAFGNLRDMGYRAEELREMEETLSGGGTMLNEIWSPEYKEKALTYLKPIHFDGNRGEMYLFLSSPVSFLYAEVRNIVLQLLLIFLLGLAGLTATVYYATNTVVKPLMHIAHFAERIASNSLDSCPIWINPDANGGHEVEVLGASIRNMLEHMEQNHQLKLLAMGAEYEKKKAEEASRARTQFFANMSHELRTPMNAIVGISDILLEQEMPESQRKHLRDIKASSEALLVIIDDILDISKIESGKFKLVNSHFSLYRMLDNVSHMASLLATGKKLSFGMERDEGVPEYIYGDEVRIRQILLNLLGNAVKFTEEGGVRLRVTVDSGNLVLEVIDTGIGIHPDDRGELYNAFRQVDTTRNRNVKGAGLGLSITMSLTKLMDGDIELESEYGSGSTFRVRLPLVPGDAAQALTEDDDGARIRLSARILVVDDNAINLKVAQGVLAIFGLSCDTAKSGAAALELASKTEYDLIFMDHMMPEMDGVETTARIRQMGGRWKSVPIVAFTANTLNGAKNQLLSAGMDDFLAKPLRKASLRQILLKWIPDGKPPAATSLRTHSVAHMDPMDMARQIVGLEVDRGLETTGGDTTRYLDLLRETREKLIPTLEALDNGDWGGVQESLAVLAGLLDRIGAAGLAAQTASLEALMAVEGAGLRGRLNDFASTARGLCTALRQLPL